MCIRDRFYSDKYAKIGFQVSDLFADEKELRERIANVILKKNVLLENLYHAEPLKEDDIYEAVSYTHLDVYKRQGQMRPVPSEKPTAIRSV